MLVNASTNRKPIRLEADVRRAFGLRVRTGVSGGVADPWRIVTVEGDP